MRSLYRSHVNNVEISSQLIYRNLQSIERSADNIFSNPIIQNTLRDMEGSSDIDLLNYAGDINYVLQSDLAMLRQFGVSSISILTPDINVSTDFIFFIAPTRPFCVKLNKRL